MGKPKHSNDPRGNQKGAQLHDEGQYGPKALEAKLAEVSDHSRRAAERSLSDPNRGGKGAEQAELHEREQRDPSLRDGRHRLFEAREQHDPADFNSEKNRLVSDVEVHGHDRSKFQVPYRRSDRT